MSSHHHHLRPGSEREGSALRRALLVTGFLFVAEIVGGIWSNSLALLSDAGHMLTDLLALGLSAAAIRFASRPADARRTFGYYRLEILSALLNGILLAVFALAILYEAVHRFQAPPEVRLEILAPVAVAGLLANVLAFWWLSRARGGLSTRAALWHTGADLAGSVLVILAAGGMALTGWWLIDPIVSIVLGGVLVWGAYRLLRESVEVLLESTPAGIQVAAVERTMLVIDGVDGVHDLHIWGLTSEVHALSGHLRVRPEFLAETDRILDEARTILRDEFRIAHTTLQVESERCGEAVCVLGPRHGESSLPTMQRPGSADR